MARGRPGQPRGGLVARLANAPYSGPADAKKADAARYKRLYLELQERDAQELRQLAQQQRDKAGDQLGKLRDVLGNALRRWKQYDELLDQVDFFLREGDAASGIEQKRLYARAYLGARNVAEYLDQEDGAGSTAVLMLEDSVEQATKAAKYVEKNIKGGYRAIERGVGSITLLVGALILWNVTKK